MNKDKLKNMWSKKVDNHLFVFHNGVVIFKRWIGKRGGKTEDSLVFDKKGYPNFKCHDHNNN